ncbi:hypothetical protein F383_28609 [Gossypium arboreum]|uniref:Uncharacterized protein n=1 Tax=Gossypium arboreum TaxID=29729 RepID=A0A0B0PAB5_GOSAR|nr:hypothetical protein F383_28609 [Gossypium arboreum]
MLVIISGLRPEGICASCYIRAKTRRHLCELLYPGNFRRYLGLEVSDLAVIISINMLIKFQTIRYVSYMHQKVRFVLNSIRSID